MAYNATSMRWGTAKGVPTVHTSIPAIRTHILSHGPEPYPTELFTAESRAAIPFSAHQPMRSVVESRAIKGAILEFGPDAEVSKVQIVNKTGLSFQVQMSSFICT